MSNCYVTWMFISGLHHHTHHELVTNHFNPAFYPFKISIRSPSPESHQSPRSAWEARISICSFAPSSFGNILIFRFFDFSMFIFEGSARHSVSSLSLCNPCCLSVFYVGLVRFGLGRRKRNTAIIARENTHGEKAGLARITRVWLYNYKVA